MERVCSFPSFPVTLSLVVFRSVFLVRLDRIHMQHNIICCGTLDFCMVLGLFKVAFVAVVVAIVVVVSSLYWWNGATTSLSFARNHCARFSLCNYLNSFQFHSNHLLSVPGKRLTFIFIFAPLLVEIYSIFLPQYSMGFIFFRIYGVTLCLWNIF